MPSHIAHTAFAVESLAQLGRADLLGSRDHEYLVLGSQGPDMFYHNQRTMPSGISFGSLLHRRSYGSFCAEILAWLVSENLGPDSAAGKYLLGYITHAILDRYMHPFINYFAGWYDPVDPRTEVFRFAHPFLERILDLRASVLPEYSGVAADWGLGAPLSGKANFGTHASPDSEIPEILLNLLKLGFGRVRPQALEDESFEQRLRNAYSDAVGFYKFCDSAQNSRVATWKSVVDRPEADRAAALGTIDSIQWSALLHPVALPADLDPLNTRGRAWQDPCGFEGTQVADAMTLWTEARTECTGILKDILGIWENDEIPENFEGIAPLVGDSGLRNRSNDPELCKMEFSQPLGFRSVLEVLDSGRIPADWLDLTSDPGGM